MPLLLPSPPTSSLSDFLRRLLFPLALTSFSIKLPTFNRSAVASPFACIYACARPGCGRPAAVSSLVCERPSKTAISLNLNSPSLESISRYRCSLPDGTDARQVLARSWGRGFPSKPIAATAKRRRPILYSSWLVLVPWIMGGKKRGRNNAANASS